MEHNLDIRWKQRFQNFRKAFARLENAVKVVGVKCDNDILQAGLIQFYEFTFELAWKTLKDLLYDDGFEAKSPKETIRTAFANGYIQNAETWMQALEDRNQTTHTYDEETIEDIVGDIVNVYYPMLKDVVVSLEEKL